MQPTLEDATGVPRDPETEAFEAIWLVADPVPGWLTKAQGRALFDAARRCPPGGRIVEIGSHQGRSTIVLAAARDDLGVVAIDPHEAGGRFGGRPTADLFRDNLERAGLRTRVTHVSARSRAARAEWAHPIDLLYIDGKHDVVTVLDDLRWVEHVSPEGEVFAHDVLGSVGVTTALLIDLVREPTVAYVDRVGSLARFRPGAPTREQRRAFLSDLPWFARNVGIKALLRARLTRISSRLGHEGPSDPY